MASRLQIPIPSDLYRDNGYPHEEALFGIPKYGGTIAEVSKKGFHTWNSAYHSGNNLRYGTLFHSGLAMP